ncbi:Low affinity iron permease-domain-containing protein [Microdochium trichocladiopsis]|uniref:Low affinity iron permease-domain-containing protein n=1 Tax=Microdochium trichocladiopsis TaxID=1682393 RepID=A0A9P8YFN4_9PEZI|nr:Low affinity iron permease-domain-containing protein [Microdochium trichocladiopsis]KAH7038359.1 Low affinity iron permease-domain-containing protein [Microdochium trichocladiopsis]
MPDANDSETEKAATMATATRTKLDRWLDAVVQFSGSSFVFLLTFGSVFAWALLGIEFASTVSWAVTISNVQAIVCYIFDSLLMRQQLTGYEEDMRNAAVLQSRLISHKRMMTEALGNARLDKPTRAEVKYAMAATIQEPRSPDTRSTPTAIMQHWKHRFSDAIAAVLGHMVTILLFWVCIAVWLGFGPANGWSDEWQLYINSSTSALLLLVFAVLSNIRNTHAARTQQAFASLARTDEELERRLRQITGDVQPNPMVTVPVPNVSRGQRAIFYYADLVGTLTGVIIMLVVIVAWIAVGPVLQFSDNWWLLIGTYAGLIGMHDGFVLENMQTCLHGYVDGALATVHEGDVSLMQDLGLLLRPEDGAAPEELESQRQKEAVVSAMSRPVVVLANVVLILGLLVGASLLQWNVTGQLLCNVPPSIIESFMMLIVITGHDLADKKRRSDLKRMLDHRLELLCWARGTLVPETK